jgi:hypothetical protein
MRSTTPVREGQCVEIDGQVYQVVDIDDEQAEVVLNVADRRGQSLMLGLLRLPLEQVGDRVLH